MTPLLSSALLRAQTDDRLVELAAAGHDRAFEAIVERYRRPLLRYLRRLLSDTLAEDVVQATFINAWSSLRTGTEVRELRPWLYRIAHNAAINSLKKVGEAMEEVPESAGGFATEPAAELERRDEMQQALTSIAALPSRQRAALLAVAVDGRAHAEVAQELGLTDGAVRQLVHRARTTLRTAATAITPLPLLHAMVASAGDSTVGRVAEVAAGAGGAGAASLSLKAGAAAVLATGALVTGGPQVAHVVHPSQRAPESAAQRVTSPGSTHTSQNTVTPLATPALAQTTPTTTAASSGGPTHQQRRRGRDADHSAASSNKGRREGTAEHKRRGSSAKSTETTSGHRRGSTSSGRGGGESAVRGGGRGDGGGDGGGGEQESASGSTKAASGGGGDDGAKGGGSGNKGGEENVVAKKPTKTHAGGERKGGGGGGGHHGDATPVPTHTTPQPTVTSPPTTEPDTSGGGSVRTETDDSGDGGGGG
jgi:RNA polymerase sigma factor (sigma-70 family)